MRSQPVVRLRTVLAGLAAVVLLGVTVGAAAAATQIHFLTQWGAPGARAGALHDPDGVAVDDRGDVYVADTGNNRVEKFDSVGHLLAIWGKNGGDGTSGRGDGEFTAPRGVAVDGQGDLYVGDSGNNRIQKFDPRGRFLARWGRNGGDGSPGLGPGEFNDPRGLATDIAGDVYVADHGNNRVQKLSQSGTFLARWGRDGGDGSAGAAPGEFRLPRGVAVDRAGNVYVADKSNNRIQKLSPTGGVLATWGRNGGNGSAGSGPGEFRSPYSVVVARAGQVFVADTGNNRLQELAPTGAVMGTWGRHGGDGTPGNGAGEFNRPYGVALDCRGGIYVSDEHNQRIQRLGEALDAPPACPPELRAGPLSRRLHRGGVALRTACERPCLITASVHLRAHGRRRPGFIARVSLPASNTPSQLVLRPPRVARLRRELRRNRGLTVRVRLVATGLGGAAKPVSIRGRIRG